MGFTTDSWRFEENAGAGEADCREALEEFSARRRAEDAEMREKLKFRLWDEGDVKSGNKLAGCGIPVPMTCTNCGESRATETRCRRRYCPACAYYLSRKRLERFAGAVALMQWPLHIILTQPNSPDPETLRDLRANWSKMRRRKIIASRISGGIASLEITNRGSGWHPHLHILADCRWLAIHTPEPSFSDSSDVARQKFDHARLELSALWASILKTEHAIVLAKRAAHGSVAAYVLKYAVKGSELLSSPDPIAPMIAVMDRTRLVSAFGNLHGRTAEMDADDRPECECVKCGQVKSFVPNFVIEIMTRRDPFRNPCPAYFRHPSL